MAQQQISVGSRPNRGDGDPLRTAFIKINDNFDELYARDLNTDAQTLTLVGNTLTIADGNSVELNISPVGDLTGSVFGDDSALLVDGVAGKIVGDVENNSVITGRVKSQDDIDLYVFAGGTGAVILAGQSDLSIGHTIGQTDIYGDVEFNNGTTAFQSGNDVEFNCPVDFENATVTGLSSINGAHNIVSADGQGINFLYKSGATETSQFSMTPTGIDFRSGAEVHLEATNVYLNNATFTDEPWISLADLKTEVAASTDFADFQARIAAL